MLNVRDDPLFEALLKHPDGLYGLATYKILYSFPDAPSWLQTWVAQEYDTAPQFPRLNAFLDWWDKEIEGKIHTVKVTHSAIIKPYEFRFVTRPHGLN
jgi:uncharacterized protein Usg